MLNKAFVLSFAGISLYALLANHQNIQNTSTASAESLVVSTVRVENSPTYQHSSSYTNSILDKTNSEWIDGYNQGEDLSDFYLNKALLFPEKEKPVVGNTNIADYYTTMRKSIAKFTAVQPYKRFTETSSLIYEIGFLITDKQEQWQYITVWKNIQGTWKRELESVAKRTVQNNLPQVVDDIRTQWMKLCNAHTPLQLIEQVYAPDAYYYNQGRLLQGQSQLSAEYKYMADPAYTLTLTPQAVFMVQPDLVYEIGKCTGSYGGHYIILWEKQPTGDWKVSLDSNY